MNKKLLPLAVAAIMAAPAAQASDLTVYGKAHVALSSYDVQANDANWDLSSHASRLGVKGSEDLGNGTKAIFKMEMQVAVADDNGIAVIDNDGGFRNMRNSYVGLAGGWGTFLMGRHDTPYKISTGSLDLFGDTIGDYNDNGADNEPGGMGDSLEFQDIRADNAVAYVSPNMNGLTVAAAFITAGGTTGLVNDLMEAYSLAAMYSNGPFFASLAYEAFDDDAVADALNRNKEKVRLGLGYTANNLHVGFVYEDADGVAAADSRTDAGRESWQLSASYTFGNNVVKAAYGESDFDENDLANEDTEQFSIGLDHNMSKRTKVYAVYTDTDTTAANAGDWSGFSAGMVHNF
jgi:predicted porin